VTADTIPITTGAYKERRGVRGPPPGPFTGAPFALLGESGGCLPFKKFSFFARTIDGAQRAPRGRLHAVGSTTFFERRTPIGARVESLARKSSYRTTLAVRAASITWPAGRGVGNFPIFSFETAPRFGQTVAVETLG